jgi:hypothetical protein
VADSSSDGNAEDDFDDPEKLSKDLALITKRFQRFHKKSQFQKKSSSNSGDSNSTSKPAGEYRPVSSAKNLDTLFRTALFGKLKSVLVGDMIRATIEAKARARTTTPMMRRKRRNSSRRRTTPRQNLRQEILPSPPPITRIPLARPRQTSARKWTLTKKNHQVPKKKKNLVRIPTPVWQA